MRAAAVSFDGEVVLAEAQRLPTGLSIDPCESLSGLEWECAARRRSVGFEAAIADPNTTFCDADEFWDALGPTFDRLAAIDGPWVNPRTDGAFGSPVPLVSDRLRRAGRTGEAVRLSRAALDAARRCSPLPARDGLER